MYYQITSWTYLKIHKAVFDVDLPTPCCASRVDNSVKARVSVVKMRLSESVLQYADGVDDWTAVVCNR